MDIYTKGNKKHTKLHAIAQRKITIENLCYIFDIFVKADGKNKKRKCSHIMYLSYLQNFFAAISFTQSATANVWVTSCHNCVTLNEGQGHSY